MSLFASSSPYLCVFENLAQTLVAVEQHVTRNIVERVLCQNSALLK